MIWLDTITKGRFEDTNKMFEKPEYIDYHVTKHLSDDEIKAIAEDITIKRIKQGVLDV